MPQGSFVAAPDGFDRLVGFALRPFMRIRPNDAERLTLGEALEEVYRRFGEPVAVLAGAAVSMAAPSSLPVSEQFYDAMAEVATNAEPRLGQRDRLAHRLRDRVPFELLMEKLRRLMLEDPSDPVTKLLIRMFSQREKNECHSTIGAHQDRGIGLLLTTNFDALLEVAAGAHGITSEDAISGLVTSLKEDPSTARRVVVHLHSSVDDPSTLGAFQRRVGRPLSGPRQELLNWASERMPLVLVGYAGQDVDVMSSVLQFTEHPIVWLRRHPAEGLPGVHIPTNLDLGGTGAAAKAYAVAALRAWLKDDLTPADRDLFLGVVCGLANRQDLALEHFREAKQSRPAGARLGLAGSLASMVLFGAAVRALQAQANHADPWADRVEVLTDRAFYRRTIGDLNGAITDYYAARAKIEPDIASHPDRIPELLAVLWREVEARLLLGVRDGNRASARVESEKILDRCAELLQVDRTVPDAEQYFYAGEITLLAGRPAEAAESYRVFAESARKWSGHEADAIAQIRRAAGLAAAGRRARATTVWATGLLASLRSFAFVHVAQYLVGLPVLFGRPGYLWRARLLATRTYPVYETLKTTLLRLRGKGALLGLAER